MRLLSRIVPKSLAGQMIALLLLALVIGQVMAFWIFADERREAVHAAMRIQILSRTTTVVRLLAVTPAELHETIVENASSDRLIFLVEEENPLAEEEPGDREPELERRLSAQLGGIAEEVYVTATVSKRHRRWHRNWSEYHHDDDDADEAFEDDHRKHGYRFEEEDEYEDDDDDDYFGPRRRGFRVFGFRAAVLLPSGEWLTADTRQFGRPPPWAIHSLAAFGIAAAVIIAVVILLVRRVTGPLTELAAAADAAGRREPVDDVRERGPRDVQLAISSFNRMRHRIDRFVDERTNLLAAISHDLRTPITALRIRAEMIEDEELRRRVLETLEEMQAITESTLLFAREEAKREETRATDLAALLESLAADFHDLGHEVTYDGPSSFVIQCRPVSLKRAFRNLVENAVTYGGNARIALSSSEEGVVVTVDDDGPGIPEDHLDRIFEPFVRLDSSRSRETGGVGLGLAIARSIVQGHGGDIEISNRDGNGLRVCVHFGASVAAS